jgi:hypothetical protein
MTVSMELPMESAIVDNILKDHESTGKGPQMSHATSETSSLGLSSSTVELESFSSSDEDDNPKNGPIDIDSGLPFASDMDESVDDLHQALALLLERFAVIPGIGKIFSVPSEQACNSDEFVSEADLEQVNHLHGSAQTVATKSDDSSLTSLDPHTDPFAKREGKTLMWRNVNMTLVSS